MAVTVVQVFVSCLLLVFVDLGGAIQCYQCDSNEDKSCPSNRPFDLYMNALVDCNSFEANIPGHFCVKITQQSPGWHGWTKVTRRCGRRSTSGVAWGCRWNFEENGVWRQTCYCEDRDGCNASSRVGSAAWLSIVALATVAVLRLR